MNDREKLMYDAIWAKKACGVHRGGFESPLFSFSYHFLLLLLVIAGMVVMAGRWKRG